MESHSEKQLLILKHMGIDVWKLRGSVVASPEKEGSSNRKIPRQNSENTSIEIPKKAEFHSVDMLDEPSSPEKKLVFSANTAADTRIAIAAGQSQDESVDTTTTPGPTDSTSIKAGQPNQPNQSDEVESETQTPIVERNPIDVICNPDAEWCFVCSSSGERPENEKTLFNAIAFALGLTQSDYSSMWLSGEEDLTDCSDLQSEVRESLASLLEQASPKKVVIFGEQPAQQLIGTDKPLNVLRQEEYRYQGGDSQLVITFGLSHLLSNPLDKSLVWEDLHKASASSA
ncbi:MAG: hypothetical protein KTR18_11405 [Acidiferrobacterales bacterium]|nr:hypothetical protein [Acidiferrobacterales bacterium]